MSTQLKPFVWGNVLLVICCIFYLAWWVIAFKPYGAVKGTNSGWLLIPAAVAGVWAVARIVKGISGINMERAAFSPLLICLIGIIVYAALLAGTWFFTKRPVTTELLLIVGWTTMVAAEINALYQVGAFSRKAAVAFLVASVAVAIISLICYLLYYDLDAMKGYYDGMVPLIIAGIMSGLTLLALHLT